MRIPCVLELSIHVFRLPGSGLRARHVVHPKARLAVRRMPEKCKITGPAHGRMLKLKAFSRGEDEKGRAGA